jgi:hypothetical protein
MYVCNIRLELQMEIEQTDVVNHVRRKGMKLPATLAELAAIYHEDAFDVNRVKYWLHEIKSHRSDLSDRPSSGRLLFENIDARILQVLEAEPWSLVQMIAEFLCQRCISSNHFSQREKLTFQMGSSFSR